MNCPVCDNVRMREVEKNGVMIDICPDCKGIWLDRGELEKLLQKVDEDMSYTQQTYDTHTAKDPYRPYPPYKHKKKKHIIFDFFDDLF